MIRQLLELQTGQVAFLSGLLAGFAMTAALNIMRTGRNTPISNFVFLTAAASSLLFLIALYVDVRLTIELAGSGHLSTAITQHVSSIRVIGTSSATVALSMFVLSMGGLGWMISNVIGVITSVFAMLTLSTLCYLWIQMNAIAPMLN